MESVQASYLDPLTKRKVDLDELQQTVPLPSRSRKIVDCSPSINLAKLRGKKNLNFLVINVLFYLIWIPDPNEGGWASMLDSKKSVPRLPNLSNLKVIGRVSFSRGKL